MLQLVQDLVGRLVDDESGQDLIEYALLITTIGFAGVFVWTLVGNAIRGTYTSWVSGVDSLTVPPAPSGGGS
jgi:Flp pilus assembly pilin Flp